VRMGAVASRSSSIQFPHGALVGGHQLAAAVTTLRLTDALLISRVEQMHS